jgi:hypothetical protein
MSNMQTFHTLLTEPAEKRDPHMERMIALTRADRAQMSAFESGLDWQQWDQHTPDAVDA